MCRVSKLYAIAASLLSPASFPFCLLPCFIGAGLVANGAQVVFRPLCGTANSTVDLLSSCEKTSDTLVPPAASARRAGSLQHTFRELRFRLRRGG